jgi:Cu-processing system permease protein
VLVAALHLADYPLEPVMLGAMLANPIDLSRLLLLVRLDGSALLGYTGALFQRFVGGTGILAAAGAVALWVVVPALIGARRFHNKDF